jgi:hypothetical protein
MEILSGISLKKLQERLSPQRPPELQGQARLDRGHQPCELRFFQPEAPPASFN